jgi:peptidoglycan/LPS O-acetylase OafA/YrhL
MLSVHKKSPHPALNNFDLIRLFAASQVALTHGAHYFGVNSWFISLLHFFPGVPIFFFISGYLIYTSYANLDKHRFAIFFTNRFLRLYPALWMCLLVTLVIVYFSGHMATQNPSALQVAAWLVSQATFFQFYNPGFLRDFGVGAVNGSLWSVAVEIQFYVLTPLLFFWMNKHKSAGYVMAALSVAAALVITNVQIGAGLAQKLLGVSFAPLFYMFVFGAVLSTQKRLQSLILSLPVWFYLAVYLGVCSIMDHHSIGANGKLNVVTFLALCPLVYKLAYTLPALSTRCLRGNDISYGVYIYHMPFVNLMIFMGMKAETSAYMVAMAATVAMALLSWFLIEKPCLKLKKRALRGYR